MAVVADLNNKSMDNKFYLRFSGRWEEFEEFHSGFSEEVYEEKVEKFESKLNEKYKNFDCKSDGIAEIIIELCRKDEMVATIIYSKKLKPENFINQVIRNILQITTISFRIEAIEELSQNYIRSCNIFLVNSEDDFNKFYQAINPQAFNSKRYFLFIDFTMTKSLTYKFSRELLLEEYFSKFNHYLNFTSISHIQMAISNNFQSSLLNSTRIFQLLWKKFILYANIVTIDHESPCSMLVTTFEPFTANTCNNTSPVIVNYYKNGSFINALSHLTKNKLKDLQSCPIRAIVATGSEPFIFVTKQSDGKLKYSGRDICLIEALAQVLNFRIDYVLVDDKGFLLDNGTASGIFKYLQNGSAELAISDLWLTRNRIKYFSSTQAYLNDDVIFVVPTGAELSPFEKLVYPMNLNVWILLLISFMAGYFAIFVIKLFPKSVQRFFFGTKVRHQYLNMWTGLLGIPQHQVPKRNFARFILVMFLLFSLVIRNSYQGSMYKFMQSNKKHDEIQTINDLLDQNDFTFYILALNMELFRPFDKLNGRITIVNTNQRYEFMMMTKNPSFKGAVAVGREIAIYQNKKLRRNLKLCKERIVTNPIVIYTQKNSFLTSAINSKLDLFISSGLTTFWHSSFIDNNYQNHNEDINYRRTLTFGQLIGCFQLLVAGYGIAFVTFCFESVIKWAKKNGLKFMRCFCRN